MSRSSSVDAEHIRPRIHAAKFTTGVLDDAEVTLTYEHPQMLIMTPTAARDINLPADDATKRGQFFLLVNGAALTHAITVKSAADAILGTLDALQTAWVFLDPGGTWQVAVSSST